jgi:hypothetical protein
MTIRKSAYRMKITKAQMIAADEVWSRLVENWRIHYSMKSNGEKIFNDLVKPSYEVLMKFNKAYREQLEKE